jgi:hypothetical protein
MVYGDIRALAVPFVLMVAKKGLDAWNKKEKPNAKPKKPSPKKKAKKTVKKVQNQFGGTLDAINAMSSYISKL